MGVLARVWGLVVAALFFASFFSRSAASLEPYGRYIYVVVLATCLVGVALALVHGNEKI